jgi:hypothetical protein
MGAPVRLHAGIARETLPDSLFQDGLKILKSEAILDAFVADTDKHRFDYPWTTDRAIEMRVVKGDAGPGYPLANDFYGLATLEGEGKMNMLDVGANIGLITIGVFKKHPEKARIIAVEPVPSTYLLFRWNLHVNGIPELSLEDLKDPNKVGVVALNTGVATVDNTETGLCYTPPRTQNARNCTCSQDREGALGCGKDKKDKQMWMITKTDGNGSACPKAKCAFGEKMLIKSYQGQQLQDFSGGVGVYNDSTGMEKEWTIEDAGDNKVFITSHRKQHLEDRGGVIGVHEDSGDWQKWSITDAGDDKVFLTSHRDEQLFPEDALRIPAPGVEQCHHLRSRSLAALFKMFDNQPISLLKMDCEGCEKALLPALTELPDQKILRFSGELHAVDNPLEDIVCKSGEEGKYFIHVCLQKGKYEVVPVQDRCKEGSSRDSCKDY